MLKLRSGQKVFVSTDPSDMRKSIDGLSMLVFQEFGKDALSGDVFVFFNRARDKAKLLYWDKTGYVLHYKRMEKHRFVISKSIQSGLEITETQLNGLLAGLDFELMGEFSDIPYDLIL